MPPLRGWSVAWRGFVVEPGAFALEPGTSGQDAEKFFRGVCLAALQPPFWPKTTPNMPY